MRNVKYEQISRYYLLKWELVNLHSHDIHWRKHDHCFYIHFRFSQIDSHQNILIC